MAQQSRGAPYPLGSDPNNTQADLQALALWVNDRPGVAALTTTQRNALTGVDRWDGKLVLDTTLDRLYRWDAGTTTWIQLPDTGDIAALLATTGLPAALADTASRGVGSSAARSDHVHPWPAWQNFTPSVVNGFSAGAGTLAGRYVQLGKTVHYRARAVLGAGFSMGNGFGFNLPVAASNVATGESLGVARFGSAGVNVWYGMISQGTATVVAGVIGTLGQSQALSPTNPFTWKATDTFDIAVTYEAS